MAAELAAWRAGPSRQAIEAFVAAVSDPGSADFVAPVERVAVFDNDGTLWCEKPMQIEVDFATRRLAEVADADPSLGERQPWKAVREGDVGWLGDALTKHYQGDSHNAQLLIGAMASAFDSIPVDDYDRRVRTFFEQARHPTLDRPYRRCGYLPMVQLLRYLEAHDFTCYIVSGSDRDFMRPVAEPLYAIPPERVVGSTLGITYEDADGAARLVYEGRMDVFDDGPEKPVRIWSRIGRRPILSAGNANGDIPMLQWSGTDSSPALRLVVLHDDAEREFDYTTGAEKLLDQASARGWTVISVQRDWETVFPDATE